MPKKWIVLLSLGLTLLSYGLVRLQRPPQAVKPLEFSSVERPVPAQTTIYVDVRGAVMHPGVYKVLSTDRVFEVIKRAGGFHPLAVKTSINQAGFLYDGDIIDVHFVGSGGPQAPTTSRISINRADQSTLETLPGIGPSTAIAIIKYREQTPFLKPEDLMNVPGIGEKTYENLKDLITP